MTRALTSLFLGFVSLAVLGGSATAIDLRTTLLRAGLSPEALAASGVSSGSVAGVVADVQQSDAYTGNALGTADAAYSSAQAEVQALEKLVAKGEATEQDIAALSTAKTERATAEAAQASALSALFTAGVGSLSAASRTTITSIRASLERPVPTEFLVKSRSEDDWTRLKRLLAHERIAANAGEECDSDVASELATLRSDADVAAAKSALTANLASVTTAWNSATAG